MLDTAKDTVEKAVKVAEEASDVTKNVAKDAYTGAKKLADKAITAVEEANYGSKLKNVAEDTFGAFKDVGNFMSNCMKSLPSPIADKAYLESLESQNISAEGASWMSQIPDSRILSHITIPGTDLITFQQAELGVPHSKFKLSLILGPSISFRVKKNW